MSLDQLIHGCKNNETKAQSELYKLFSGKLFALCLKYSRNYAEAEDNLQDTFLTVFKKIGQFKGKGSFEGWLKRIAINTSLQKYRSKVSLLHLVNEKIPAHEEKEMTNQNLNIDFLLICIQQLPDRYRLVFNLYALDGYKHKEIAEMLKITEGTSKSNLARARIILKEKIEQYNSSVSAQVL